MEGTSFTEKWGRMVSKWGKTTAVGGRFRAAHGPHVSSPPIETPGAWPSTTSLPRRPASVVLRWGVDGQTVRVATTCGRKEKKKEKEREREREREREMLTHGERGKGDERESWISLISQTKENKGEGDNMAPLDWAKVDFVYLLITKKP